MWSECRRKKWQTIEATLGIFSHFCIRDSNNFCSKISAQISCCVCHYYQKVSVAKCYQTFMVGPRDMRIFISLSFQLLLDLKKNRNKSLLETSTALCSNILVNNCEYCIMECNIWIRRLCQFLSVKGEISKKYKQIYILRYLILNKEVQDQMLQNHICRLKTVYIYIQRHFNSLSGFSIYCEITLGR